MNIVNRFLILTIIVGSLFSCAWYKGPEPSAVDSSGTSLDGSSLGESGSNTISLLKSGENSGGNFADDGGNFETTDFDNVT
ncbi:hypothetical protein [Francisella adeliensis]|uniref:Lipoprotein n=1 Tax=Francisella adeliensis TaxID=2007306 RepID=A0A2Z4XWA7_9GAMM|nr:hypothetical protein [Francisella adeliensis]AXA33127.1 hypothetical protein CDH04_01250 [Francisella adeliensis]MBK2085981.1 hypothetical protein [Francisella adeliensis]MBK2096855.1 hypothetical protein [Francisella adeliensis]QIW11356.1 hypothetical protein FZC43_01250 [Francisella adeliensis]QIW13231.1 hypothetical protein FZC44_01250 [Francisella adeliensis]